MKKQIALIVSSEKGKGLMQHVRQIIEAVSDIFAQELECKILEAGKLSEQQIAWQAFDCDAVIMDEPLQKSTQELAQYLHQEARFHTHSLPLIPFSTLKNSGTKPFHNSEWMLVTPSELYLKSGSQHKGAVAFETHSYCGEQLAYTIRQAFEFARRRNQKVSFVQADYYSEVNQLWKACSFEMAEEYSDVRFEQVDFEQISEQLTEFTDKADVIIAAAPQAAWFKAMIPNCSDAAYAYAAYHVGESGNIYQPAFSDKNPEPNPLGILFALQLLLENELEMHQAARQLKASLLQIAASGELTADMRPKKEATTEQVIKHLLAVLHSDQWIEEQKEELV